MSANISIPDAIGSSALPIAVIGPDDRRRAAITNALSECRDGQIREFVGYPSKLDEAAQMLAQAHDIVLVDLDSDPEVALDLVEGICLRGSAAVMVYSTHANPDLMLRCMRAGVREFLPLPCTGDSMAEALVRAAARRPIASQFLPAQSVSAQPSPETYGGLFAFMGSKGGAGVTTVACNFAVSLAQESLKKTLLIDLNLPLGDAALALGIKAQYSTLEALHNSSRLDPSFLSTLLVRHSSGLSVLAAPSVLTAIEVTNDAIDTLLTVARRKFDYVVVDAGSRFDLQRTALFNECATIYLVTQVGIPELRNANRLITQFSHDGSPRLQIVINRFDSRSSEFSEGNILKALTRPADWKIPNSYAAVRRMHDTAAPLVLEDSPISRTIRSMAKVVCGKSDTPFTEKKKWFSLFR
jgi:pilus assembly protein CpaE